MTEPKHTPGPLRITNHPGTRRALASNPRLVIGTSVFVAEVGLPVGAVSDATNLNMLEANAHLLAAAYTSYDKHCGARAVECAEADLLRELLGACKAARDLYDHLALGTLEAAVKYGPNYEPPSDADWLALRSQLEAAIAKAEGSTP